MAYEDYEKSTSDGEPVELFKFTKGTDKYYYTSANVVVEYDFETYEPVYISRNSLEQSGESVKNELMIIVHRTNDLVAHFIASSPEVPITFTLFRGHEDSFVTLWVGSVLGVLFEEDDAKIRIGPPHRGGRTTGLRRKYQKQCTYPLYNFQCKVDKPSYAWAGTVTVINGNTLTVPEAATKVDGWFKGGILVSGETERMITGHSGSTIYVGQGVNLIDAGDACTLYAGCGHWYSVCGDKFSNKINYGGQPWIPSRNPFGGDGVT